MPRARNGVARLKRRNKLLKQAKGFIAGRGRLYRAAKAAVVAANQYAFYGRKERKRDFRRLWITRISGALLLTDLTYSQFIHGLKLAKIDLNRKMISELAIHEPTAFNALVAKAADALKAVAVAH